MVSYLEIIPTDVLQHIALLASVDASYPFASLHTIPPLLSTNSAIYHSLSLKSCPHLYADIFRSKFDVRATLRRFSFHITDSALASELVLRCQMLRRVRDQTYALEYLRQDLWTAFWMIQESDGLNESHLSAASFPEFLLSLIPRLKQGFCGKLFPAELRALVIWLLCFTLTRKHIISLLAEKRDTLYNLLLSFVRRPQKRRRLTATFLLTNVSHSDQKNFPIDGLESENSGDDRAISIYGRQWIPHLPDPTPAAINLISGLRDIFTIFIPDHLPETRSAADFVMGPTKEDVRKFQGFKTKLFADTLERSPRTTSNRSILHELEFGEMVCSGEGTFDVKSYSVMPGMLSGVWDGFYMIGSEFVLGSEARGDEDREVVPDFFSRQPLQCVFIEFVCFDGLDKNDKNDKNGLQHLPRFSSEIMGGFEIKGRKYERLERCQRRRKDVKTPVDIVILGETLEEHAQAWGGYRYAGRVRRDGSVIFKREPKLDDDKSWTFEGSLRFGEVLVGTWTSRTSPIESNFCLQGIFSLQKTARTPTSW